MSPLLCRYARVGGALLLAVFLLLRVDSQTSSSGGPQPASQPDERSAVDIVKALGGATLALAMHEGGHLAFDAAFDARPRLERVHFGPFPFFAVAHRGDLSPRRELTVSSAGFWVQEASSEWLLTRRHALRHEHAPLAKGVLAFNVLNSVGYACVAFARRGPFERDTRGVADSIGVDERAIGAVVLAPALFDAYRFFRPDARWAKWASRAVKAGSVLLVVRQAHR